MFIKYACDSAGHYARPDVLRLWHNAERQQVRTQHMPAPAREPLDLRMPAEAEQDEAPMRQVVEQD